MHQFRNTNDSINKKTRLTQIYYGFALDHSKLCAVNMV